MNQQLSDTENQKKPPTTNHQMDEVLNESRARATDNECSFDRIEYRVFVDEKYGIIEL